MKKVAKLMPIFSMIMICLLFFVFLNFNESSNFLKLKNYSRESISLEYDSNSANLIENIKNIQDVAQKNNVILLKVNADNENPRKSNLYFSLNSIDELYKLISKNFKIKKINNKKNNSNFISTYNTHSANQIGLIEDLFDNDYYSYYLFDSLYENNNSLFGNYYVFYKDYSDYNKFVYDIKNIVGYDVQSISASTKLENYVMVVLFGAFIFLFLLYFIFQIFDYNSNSKKIGCMRILGFDIKKINFKMIYKNMIVYFITSLIIILFSVLFVKNIGLFHIIILFLICLFLIIITYIISLSCCSIINNNYKVSNILKSQSTTSLIIRISNVLKVIMTVLIIIFSTFLIGNCEELHNKMKKYNSSKNLLEYSVLQSYVADQPEIFEYEKQYELYLKIRKNFDTVYASFNDYSQYTMDDIKRIKQNEKNGQFYEYASVDVNYLKKEKINVYDLNGTKVNVNKINQVVYLFPKSKSQYIDAFHEFYKDLDNYFLQFNSNYSFKAYLYDVDII